MPNGRIVAGFLVAPLASGFMHAVHVGSIRAGLVALLVAYAATLLLGVPTVMVFSRLGWSRLWQAALAGVCTGIVAAVVALVLISFANGRVVSAPLTTHFLMLFAFHGSMVACLYWILTARCHAPRDRTLSR